MITVDGHRITEAAAVNLAADGFVQLLRYVVTERPEPDGEAEGGPDDPRDDSVSEHADALDSDPPPET